MALATIHSVWQNHTDSGGYGNRKDQSDAGYTDIYKTTLLGVGDLEKRMGRKAFRDVLGKLVYKPEGTPTLVPVSDPRQAISTAASDFAE